MGSWGSYSKFVDTPENILTDHDKEVYGDWEPEGYTKLSLLGKGGAAVVWLAKSKANGNSVAIKQFSKKNDTSSVDLEIEIANWIYNKTISATEYPGIKYISKLLDLIDAK